jgi:hypothetical protein
MGVLEGAKRTQNSPLRPFRSGATLLDSTLNKVSIKTLKLKGIGSFSARSQVAGVSFDVCFFLSYEMLPSYIRFVTSFASGMPHIPRAIVIFDVPLSLAHWPVFLSRTRCFDNVQIGFLAYGKMLVLPIVFLPAQNWDVEPKHASLRCLVPSQVGSSIDFLHNFISKSLK